MIIIDAPALGLVSDALRLSKFADATLYMVRLGHTQKEDLDFVNELKLEEKLVNPALVLNGVPKGRIYKRALKKGYYQK